VVPNQRSRDSVRSHGLKATFALALRRGVEVIGKRVGLSHLGGSACGEKPTISLNSCRRQSYLDEGGSDQEDWHIREVRKNELP
jgi:hypothetical protein